MTCQSRVQTGSKAWSVIYGGPQCWFGGAICTLAGGCLVVLELVWESKSCSTRIARIHSVKLAVVNHNIESLLHRMDRLINKSP